MTAEPKELQKSLSKLSLASSTAPTITHTKSKPSSKSKIADSWEDDEESSEASEADISIKTTPNLPNAPPPTPISPTSPNSFKSTEGRFAAYEDTWSQPSNGIENPRSPSRGTAGDGRRPEKTTAVAGRLIAGALGVRAPKKTEEQRAYDRAVREKEQKRRDAEKEEAKRAEEDIARAKAAAWED